MKTPRWLVGVIVFGVPITWLLLWTLSQYQYGYLQRQLSASEARVAEARALCVETLGWSFCRSDEAAARAEAERSERDLAAQQDMAEWAKWITLFTALQVAVSIGGTALLVGTLRQGQEANRIARDTGQAQTRAYLTVLPEHISSFGPNTVCEVKIRVDNTGNSPAHRIRRRIIFSVIGNPVRPPPDTIDMSIQSDSPRGFSLGAKQFINLHSPTDRPFSTDELDRIRSRSASIGALVHLEYEDVFGVFHDEEIGFVADMDDETLVKLTNDYQGTDLSVTFRRIEGFGRST